ncbi:MAG TPA: YceI family protein [Chryseolinea sp.]|jgi:polyisoprenoid-binding protein YceI|uniref:Polyisoprenoid-binding protein YceI n=1 Tax=Chryseolinea serpens TaxID=947013 RepID=A0A1M5LT42_9BACT|nr:YceI family protein [Chryseolinea serpens]SHG68156.1 Polyisoprenoid-binding protein YceI [Chryseolinea serpens]
MKKMNTLFALLFVSAGVFAQTMWNVDKNHTNIQFNVSHMVVSEVNGSFTDFTGAVKSKSDDFNGADVEFTAKVASISTNNEKRDGHLKSDDFFNAEKFPEVKFKGTLVKENGKYLLKGNLTLRDVTKPVTFDVTYGGTVDTGNGVKAGFKLNGKINRLEYGLKWSNKLANGEMVVGDQVEIVCKIELNKAAA